MSLLRHLFEKINESILNTFIAKADEYYSYNEPSPEKMKDKRYWIQIIRGGDE